MTDAYNHDHEPPLPPLPPCRCLACRSPRHCPSAVWPAAALAAAPAAAWSATAPLPSGLLLPPPLPGSPMCSAAHVIASRPPFDIEAGSWYSSRPSTPALITMASTHVTLTCTMYRTCEAWVLSSLRRLSPWVDARVARLVVKRQVRMSGCTSTYGKVHSRSPFCFLTVPGLQKQQLRAHCGVILAVPYRHDNTLADLPASASAHSKSTAPCSTAMAQWHARPPTQAMNASHPKCDVVFDEGGPSRCVERIAIEDDVHAAFARSTDTFSTAHATILSLPSPTPTWH
jgi:hypothetical protein